MLCILVDVRLSSVNLSTRMKPLRTETIRAEEPGATPITNLPMLMSLWSQCWSLFEKHKDMTAIHSLWTLMWNFSRSSR